MCVALRGPRPRAPPSTCYPHTAASRGPAVGRETEVGKREAAERGPAQMPPTPAPLLHPCPPRPMTKAERLRVSRHSTHQHTPRHLLTNTLPAHTRASRFVLSQAHETWLPQQVLQRHVLGCSGGPGAATRTPFARRVSPKHPSPPLHGHASPNASPPAPSAAPRSHRQRHHGRLTFHSEPRPAQKSAKRASSRASIF